MYRFQPGSDVVEWVNELEAESFKLSVWWIPAFVSKFTVQPHGERQPVLDVLSSPHKFQNHMDVIVAPEFASAFLSMLQAKGVAEVDVIAENIQKSPLSGVAISFVTAMNLGILTAREGTSALDATEDICASTVPTDPRNGPLHQILSSSRCPLQPTIATKKCVRSP